MSYISCRPATRHLCRPATAWPWTWDTYSSTARQGRSLCLCVPEILIGRESAAMTLMPKLAALPPSRPFIHNGKWQCPTARSQANLQG